MADGRLRQILREFLPEMDWTSVETGGTAGGVPDCNFCFAGSEGWIECKLVTRGWKVSVRPSQVGWISRRCRHGGRVFLLTRRTVGDRDDLHVLDGRLILDFSNANFSLQKFIMPTYRGGPREWPWQHLRKMLTAPLHLL